MAVPSTSEPDEGARPTLYLVFAGLHREKRRGADDLVAVSASRDEARDAFRAVRLGLADDDGWAELTAVTDGATRRLSWFGTGRWARPNPLTAMAHQRPDSLETYRRRRRVRRV
jgi:hypothetical protein